MLGTPKIQADVVCAWGCLLSICEVDADARSERSPRVTHLWCPWAPTQGPDSLGALAGASIVYRDLGGLQPVPSRRDRTSDRSRGDCVYQAWSWVEWLVGEAERIKDERSEGIPWIQKLKTE